MLIYKRLSSNELPLFKQLTAVFKTVFAGEEVFEDVSDTYLQRLLEQESFWVYLTLDEQMNVLGGLTAYELPKYHSESSYLYIFDLAILPEYQRQGLGKKLIESLIKEATEQGFEEVFVQADKGDEGAISFYKKTGGQPEDVIHFSFPLS